MGTLHLDQIIERLSNSDQVAPNYTIRLTPPAEVTGTIEFLVLASSATGYVAYILQFEPSEDSPRRANIMDGFSGFVRILNLERTTQSEERFENGNQIDSAESGEGGRSKVYENCDCYYDYRPVYGPVTGAVIGEDIWIVCNCTEGSGGGETGEIGTPLGDGGSGNYSEGPHTGSGGGSGGGAHSDPIGLPLDELPVSLYDVCAEGHCIVNQLENPCLKGVVDHALTPSATTVFNSIIQDIFNSNDKVNLLLTENASIPAYARTLAPVVNDDIMNITIQLKTASLVGTSKEFIAAVVFHEAFHAIAHYLGTYTATEQHIVLYSQKLDLLATALQSAYPTMDMTDARGLILSGILANKPGTVKYHNPQLAQEIISRQGFTENSINLIMLRYQQHSSGHTCN